MHGGVRPNLKHVAPASFQRSIVILVVLHAFYCMACVHMMIEVADRRRRLLLGLRGQEGAGSKEEIAAGEGHREDRSVLGRERADLVDVSTVSFLPVCVPEGLHVPQLHCSVS